MKKLMDMLILLIQLQDLMVKDALMPLGTAMLFGMMVI